MEGLYLPIKVHASRKYALGSLGIQKSEKNANQTLRMERRWKDIQERDRIGQERKNKLTNNGKLGLKYTSEAMARR